jgi:hypothetical protein
MSLASVRSELEYDLAWRKEELVRIRNLIFDQGDEVSRDQLRRTYVVMLYAHFEGYCRLAFSTYVAEINAAGLKRREVVTALRAGSMTSVFRAYENRDAKCEIFAKALPDDSALHRLARQIDLVGEFGAFESKDFELDPETIVQTESNLKPVVLRKILYALGLPWDSLRGVEGAIYRMVNVRNDIGHGARKSGIKEDECAEFDAAFVVAIQKITDLILEAVSNRLFLASGSVVASVGA